VLLVALVGCGGTPERPPEAPKAPAPPKPAPVVETADLSPVAAPAGLFVVGRLKRPTAATDTLAHWAGVPFGLRDVLPMGGVKDLDSVLAWDAPVELAVAVAPSGRRGVVEAGISIGLTGTEQALAAARRLGLESKRLAPEIYAVEGIPHSACAIAPAIGSASARLVCSHRAAELDDLLPYMTRGLPNERLGERDLELEVRVEPLRQRFASEIGSARLFAGFVVRELQLDTPRFDTALSDTAYALADEFVALTRDVNTIRLEATVDDQKRVVDADWSIAFGDHKSWCASALAERGKHQGPAPDKFFAQAADATSAAYNYPHDPAAYERLTAGLSELADAYLEHEKVGKATRDRVTRLIQTYGRWDGASVTVAGNDSVEPSGKPEKNAGSKLESSDWMVLRIDSPPPTLKGLLADVGALLDDRELRALLAKTLKIEEKELPTGKFVALKGAGVPAGTRALVVKSSTELGPLLGRSFGLADKSDAGSGPSERAIAVVVSATGAVVASAENVKVLGTRLGQALAGKVPTLATRNDLQRLHELQANWAGFTTLVALVGSSLRDEIGDPNRAFSAAPHHGQAPVFLDFSMDQTGSTARWHASVPAAVFEDMPGLAPIVGGRLLGRP
jgi:hypothetical protein